MSANMTSSLLSVLPMNVFLPGAQLAQLLKNKMLLHATPNNLSGNRTINAEMQKNYNAVKDNVILKNLIASENLTALWDRLGALITTWVNDPTKVRDQAREAGDLFKDFMMTRGVDVAGGHKALNPQGQAFADRIGFGSGKCDWGCDSGKCTHGK